MRPGYNPARRSRNIGTAKQGHGQDNRLTIPAVCADERDWTAQLGPHREVKRTIAGRSVLFIVETTTNGCIHNCSVDDVCRVLGLIPRDAWESLDTVVFRQSKRKDRILRPAWGRMSYGTSLGRPGRATRRSGPVIWLEAFDPAKCWVWPTSLTPDDQAELDRLREDGHRLERVGHEWRFTPSTEAVRNTQLYRTLLHEIGHWADWSEKVERPEQAGAGSFEDLQAAYFARPSSEREAFAHRWAEQAHERLARFGEVPFERIIDREKLVAYGLRPDDFGLEAPSPLDDETP